MDAPAAPPPDGARLFSRGLVGPLDPGVAERVVAAGGDLALVIDAEGVIRDLALSDDRLREEGAETWLDRRWVETVTVESRPKVEQMLAEARRGSTPQWREINQVLPGREPLMVRFLAFDAGEDRVIALGRDAREAAALQQRLLQAQQSLERDYSRFRDAEFRYRLLFRMAAEAVLVVDGSTRRVSEANPAAERLIGQGKPLVGEGFARLFAAESQDAAAALIAAAQSPRRGAPPEARLTVAGGAYVATASLFRQDRASHVLVRIAPAGPAAAGPGDSLEAVLERFPDPFVLTDEALIIRAANTAFLDLARIPTADLARGQALGDLLGRAGLERNVLLEALKTHGSVRNFATVIRNTVEEEEDVEVSAVAASDGEARGYGVTLRPLGRRASAAGSAPELRRSVEQLTELVGRVTLKELVRETTELVERLCIEAALELTRDNRASAAEILGLSRQSLYSKLHRFGLGNLGGEDDRSN